MAQQYMPSSGLLCLPEQSGEELPVTVGELDGL